MNTQRQVNFNMSLTVDALNRLYQMLDEKGEADIKQQVQYGVYETEQHEHSMQFGPNGPLSEADQAWEAEQPVPGVFLMFNREHVELILRTTRVAMASDRLDQEDRDECLVLINHLETAINRTMGGDKIV